MKRRAASDDAVQLGGFPPRNAGASLKNLKPINVDIEHVGFPPRNAGASLKAGGFLREGCGRGGFSPA